MVKAVVIRRSDRPIEVVDIEVGAPKVGELAIRIVAAGVCHSDLSLAKAGGAGMELPVVLGHEAAGIVERVGEGVAGFGEGDHVILSPVPQCHHCRFCDSGQWTLCDSSLRAFTGKMFDGTTRMSLDGAAVTQMACIGAWSERTVVPAMSAVKIDKAMPLEQAALIGCGVVTGYGAAVNVADISRGDSVAVIGCGGTGLNAVQGARLRGAERIIAVDVIVEKLELARRFGATDTINAESSDAVAAVQDLTAGYGVDVGIDAVGTKATFAQVVAMTRRGGQCILSGMAAPDLSFSMMQFTAAGKILKGNMLGMGDFRVEFPKLVKLYQDGELMLDELITKRISLEQVNTAFEDMEAGKVARSVIDL
ncbi:MAG: alcohol dehydrogenase [Caulobacteraceae bacterium]|nr:alcohol dehydrogenase [Caulobacteraceae bacterium]